MLGAQQNLWSARPGAIRHSPDLPGNAEPHSHRLSMGPGTITRHGFHAQHPGFAADSNCRAFGEII
ncbi:hypothetical protein [Burkholderia ubonensis]|uniref:hypothetical protein n=1 Tax=Burkholderia ubonensis TaxID=101571 RepID=UPI0012F7635C|nr:hypothetical protein [Burkholderia ubonensis]